MIWLGIALGLGLAFFAAPVTVFYTVLVTVVVSIVAALAAVWPDFVLSAVTVLAMMGGVLWLADCVEAWQSNRRTRK